jgi:gliding motility-associated-like protein
LIGFNLIGQGNLDFVANKTTVCSPEAVQFSIINNPGSISYSWDFGNGTTSNLQNPTIVYTRPGIYTVRLTIIENNAPVTVSKTNYIKVFAPPIANFSTNKTTGCIPLDVSFTDLSSPQSAPIKQWFWSFSNGNTSTQQYPSTTYSEVKSNTVFLKVTDDNGCSATRTQQNYIEVSGPTANFEYDSLVCGIPSNVNFLNTSKGKNLTYNWSFGDGGTSTNEIPGIHTYTSFDSTLVTLVATNSISGCSDTIQKPMIIADYQADFDFDVSCTENTHSISFTNLTSPEANNYRWDFDDGSFSSQKNVVKDYNNRIGHRILLTATIDASCVDTISKEYVPPVANFSSFAEECSPPMIVEFTNLSLGANLSYDWFFGDSTFSNESDPIHLFQTPPDNYRNTLSIVDDFGCYSTTNQQVNAPFPIARFYTVDSVIRGCLPLTVTFIDTLSYTVDSQIESVIWDFGDPNSGSLNTSTSLSPTHIYNEPGEYDITYTIQLENGCTDQITVEEFIKVGVAPDSLNFEYIPNDTFCFGEIIDFSPYSEYNSFPVTSNYHCWLFETDSVNRLSNAEIPPLDCPEPQQNYLILDTSINHQAPRHQYENFEYTFKASLNDNLVWGTAQPSFGNQYTHLIAGYNGCFKSIVKPNYTDTTALIPGFVFNNDSADLFLEDTSAWIGIFLNNFGIDSLTSFEIREGNTVINVLNPNDTNIVQFQSPGIYNLFVEGWNTTSNCSYELVRRIRVDNPTLISDFEKNVCLSERKILIDENSSFIHSQIRNRDFYLNDSLITSTSGAINDSALIHFQDTGWNNLRIELKVLFSDDIEPTGTSFKFSNYTYVDSFYVHGSYSIPQVDTNFTCFGDTFLLDQAFTGTNPLDSIVWRYNEDTARNILTAHKFSFLERGNFIVQYELYNDFGCIDTFYSDELTVSGPIVDFEISDTLVCVNEAVEFMNSSIGESLNFVWKTENVEYFNIDVTHEYSVPDTFDITLIATDIFSCSDSLIKYDVIEAAPFPEANFSADTTSASCPPLLVQFSDYSTGNITSYHWEFDENNTSSSRNPLETFIAPGSYNILLAVTNYAGCRDSLTIDSLINISGPNGSYHLTKDTLCSPDTVVFNGDFDNTKFFIWNYGDGDIDNFETSSQSDTVDHTYNTGGKFSPFVQLIDSNNCQFTLPINGTLVSDSIDARFSINDSIICSLSTILPTNNSRSSFVNTFEWELGNGTIIEGFQPNLNYNSSGNFVLKLIQTSPIGCKDSLSKPITLFDDPQDTLRILNDDFCVPNTTDFILEVRNPNFVAESLNLTIDGQNFTDSARFTQSLPNEIPVSYSIIYGSSQCIIDTSFTIQYYEWPIGNFTFSPEQNSIESSQVQFTANVENTTDYYWDFGDNQQSVSQNPIHRYSAEGNYNVALVISNGGGCTDTIIQNIAISPFDFIRIPNAFTPNGDGVDDTFGALYAGEVDFIEMNIFNEWGNLIFNSNNIDKRWDGNKNEKPQPTGTYVYVIKYNENGSEQVLKGTLTLIR